MTRRDAVGATLLVLALTTSAAAQDPVTKLPPEAVALRANQVVTVCGEALDLACHGPLRSAILTFITPSASPSVTITAADGAHIDVETQSVIHAQPVCVTGKVVAVAAGYQIQISNRDQLTFTTQAPSLADGADRPRRSCEPGVLVPRVRRDVKPMYTADAMRRKVAGRVVLQGRVDTNGVVSDVHVIRSLDPGGLDVAAVEAFTRWQFDPARSGGTPIPVLVTADLTFTLK